MIMNEACKKHEQDMIRKIMKGYLIVNTCYTTDSLIENNQYYTHSLVQTLTMCSGSTYLCFSPNSFFIRFISGLLNDNSYPLI